MNVLSLFDGMSCGQIALEKCGVKVDKYFASEIDKFAVQVAKKNYPNTVHLGDVRNVKGDGLPKIDLLMGGSPCQGFSFSGKQLNFDDERSKLFFKFVRILGETKPKYFLLENVRMKKEYQDIISAYLGVEPIMINSSLVSAQSRNRLYWTNIPNVKQPQERHIFLGDIVESPLHERPSVVSRCDLQTREKIFSHVQHLLGDSKYRDNFKWRWDGEGRILVTRPDGLKIQRVGRIAFADNKAEIVTALTQPTVAFRKVTPLECERLQTVPDNYTSGVSKSQRYKMLGNGWTVDVISHILSGIK